ncbi:MAG: hypothetical protein KAQ95_10345, partial [Candidatus Heimdallarchaeota archaeon]|nr:hypothetical protein [Candidatus Heimdallarchaeota archaeon]
MLNINLNDRVLFDNRRKALLSIIIVCTLLASACVFVIPNTQAYSVEGNESTITVSDQLETPQQLVPEQVADWYAKVGQWDENYGDPLDIHVQNDIAYLAMGPEGLLTMDISNPENPQICGSYKPEKTDFYGSIVVDDDFTYIGSFDYGLEIFNTTDIANPMKIGEYSGIGYVNDIAVQDNYIYVTRGSYGFTIFDVTDPYHPFYNTRIYSLSGYEYLRLFVEGNYAYALVMDGFEIIDISDPNNPYVVSYYSELDMWVEDIWGDGEHIYLTSFERLLILDVTDPYNPIKISEHYEWGLCFQVRYSNDFLFINGGWEGLKIIDVSDILNPILVDVLTIAQYTWGIGMDETTIVTASMEYSAIEIFDVTNPLAASKTGDFKFGSSSLALDIFGDYCFLANYLDGLMVLDISDPSQPSVLSVFNEGGALDVVVDDTYIYLAAYQGGFKILDWSDPVNLV